MTLAKAEAALSKKPEAALEAILEVWRKTFDPELGKLIEPLGAQLARPIEGLSTKKKERAAQLASLAAKAESAQRSAVLTAFEIFAREATGALVWPSVEAWVEVKPDPRVARMALRVLSESQHHLTAKLWRRLTNCVEHHGDLGVVDEARAYEELLKSKGGGWGFSPERFSNVLKKLAQKRKCVEPSDPAAIGRLSKAIGAAPGPSTRKLAAQDDAAMIEAIVASPDDDGPRLVYADWLTEHQDPRGEFINLQIQRAAGGGTKASKAREEALLADHRSVFLGPFAKCVEVSGLRFERGFVATAKFKDMVPVHPLTRLLVRVTLDYLPVPKDAQLDGVRALSLASVSPQRDREILARPRLEELTMYAVSEMQATLDLITSLPSLSGLKRLSLSGGRAGSSALTLKKVPATVQKIELMRSGIEATFERSPAGWVVDVDVRPNTLSPPIVEALDADAFKSNIASMVIHGWKLAQSGLQAIAERLNAKLKLR